MSTETEIAASEFIEKAAELIRANGWQQGSFGYESTPVCARGAIREICRKNSFYRNPVAILTKITKVIADQYPEMASKSEHLSDSGKIILWNDQPGRTKEEVIAVFEKAARS